MPRRKGVPNRVTKQSRKILVDVLEQETGRIKQALDALFEESKRDYLLVMSRMLPYILPKASPEEVSITITPKKPTWFDESPEAQTSDDTQN